LPAGLPRRRARAPRRVPRQDRERQEQRGRTIVEDSLDAGERVCVIDPTGAWWGLRLNRSGKASKYPVVIFGGLHGDVPIGREHGAAVAEVVATSSTPAVIDTRLMTVGERTQFFTAFAQTLLRKNKGPLRLVVDEAHVFAPQGRVADPRSGEMLHAANNLVSLGRSIGLRIMLISQRPAKLHKDSLTQVETLVAMRVIAPQDRKAIEEWIGDQADKDQGKEIVASLPSLKTGDAWVWSPEIGFLERVHFPLARTYDSGKAPTGGEGGPELQPLKLDEVNAARPGGRGAQGQRPAVPEGRDRPAAARARRGGGDRGGYRPASARRQSRPSTFRARGISRESRRSRADGARRSEDGGQACTRAFTGRFV
jgi:hypothetical protein